MRRHCGCVPVGRPDVVNLASSVRYAPWIPWTPPVHTINRPSVLYGLHRAQRDSSFIQRVHMDELVTLTYRRLQLSEFLQRSDDRARAHLFHVSKVRATWSESDPSDIVRRGSVQAFQALSSRVPVRRGAVTGRNTDDTHTRSQTLTSAWRSVFQTSIPAALVNATMSVGRCV
jgi:hypothetical protein